MITAARTTSGLTVRLQGLHRYDPITSLDQILIRQIRRDQISLDHPGLSAMDFSR